MSHNPEWKMIPGTKRGFKSDNGLRTTTWSEIYDDLEEKIIREVTAVEISRERYRCYCCTCNATDKDGHETGALNDPACRNHGYAAERPCDIHGLPGAEWDPHFDFHPNEMPMAVGVYREAVLNGKPTH